MSPDYITKLREALSDILREIDETRKRLSYLEASAENIRKCLPQPLIHKNLAVSDIDAPTLIEMDTQPHKRKSYRKKNTHAMKIYEIVKNPEKTWKIKDVIEAYPGRGWEIPLGNAYNQIYRNIKDRPDLFIYKDGHILPKIPGQAPSREVIT